MAAPDAQQPGAEQAAAEPHDDKLTPVHFGVTDPHEVRSIKDEEGNNTGMLEHIPMRERGIEQTTVTVGLPERLVHAIMSGARDWEAVHVGLDDLSAYREVLSSLQHHTPNPAVWVHSPHTALGEKVAAFLGLEHEGAKREDWDSDGLPPVAGGSPYLAQHYHDPSDLWREAHEPENGTIEGRDLVLECSANEGAQPAPLKYIALSADNTAFTESESLVNESSLTGELNKASGALNRAAAVITHAAKAKTSLFKITFTANGSDTLPVTVNKFAVFNASSSGKMGIVVKISATPLTFNAVGDKGEIQETLEVTAFT